jgi:GNAT superfamily N-acetyltransferase
MPIAVNVSLCEERKGQVISLLEQVYYAASEVAEGRPGFSELHENIMQLESFIFNQDADQERAEEMLARLHPEIIARVNGAYSLWQTRQESQFAIRIVKGEAALSDFAFYDRFDDLVRREQALLPINRMDRVLSIGSGPLPLTAMLLHLRTRAAIDCLARDPGAVALSRQVLEKCGLSGPVRILDGTRLEHDLSRYNAVIVEALAKPKKNLLKLLRKRCSRGCQVLYRTAHGLRRLLLHDAAPDADFPGFYVKNKDLAIGAQTASIFLLEPARSIADSVQLTWLQDVDTKMGTKILQLMNRTLREETTIGFPGPIAEEEGMVLMRQLGADIAAARRHVLVAEKDGFIVGQLILTPNSSPNHWHIVELTRGTIAPSFRGGGLALRAFHEVAKKCDELGREVICLDVRAGTLAAMWWQHFGFKPYGLLSDYSRVDDKKYEGLYLTQTTAELKERLHELAAMADAAGAPA